MKCLLTLALSTTGDWHDAHLLAVSTDPRLIEEFAARLQFEYEAAVLGASDSVGRELAQLDLRDLQARLRLALGTTS